MDRERKDAQRGTDRRVSQRYLVFEHVGSLAVQARRPSVDDGEVSVLGLLATTGCVELLHKFHYTNPLGLRKRFDLFNQFRCAHAETLSRTIGPVNGRFLGFRHAKEIAGL